LHLVGGLERPTVGRAHLPGDILGRTSELALTESIYGRRDWFFIYYRLPVLAVPENVAQAKFAKWLRPAVR